jgi:hypothetical protein
MISRLSRWQFWILLPVMILFILYSYCLVFASKALAIASAIAMKASMNHAAAPRWVKLVLKWSIGK